MTKMVVEGQQKIFDKDVEDTFISAYAIASDGGLIKPDKFEEREGSTRGTQGVFKWTSIWDSMPKTALVVKVVCKRDGTAYFETLQLPHETGDRQLLILESILEGFNLSFF